MLWIMQVSIDGDIKEVERGKEEEENDKELGVSYSFRRYVFKGLFLLFRFCFLKCLLFFRVLFQLGVKFLVYKFVGYSNV